MTGRASCCVFDQEVRFLRFFFFQAEDGIRDDLVTGVQTCALPIFLPMLYSRIPLTAKGARTAVVSRKNQRGQIGRASCRERVQNSGVAVAIKNKNEKKSELGVSSHGESQMEMKNMTSGQCTVTSRL